MSASLFREAAARAFGLLRNPWVILCGLLVCSGSALARVSLFGVPGYDFSVLMAVIVGLVGGAVGVAAARQERRLIIGHDPRPRGARRVEAPLAAVALAGSAAFLLNLLFLVPPLVVAVVATALGATCDPWRGLPFYALLPVPSAALAACVGTFAGFAAETRKVAAAAFALAVLASLAMTLWPLWAGPQVFAFNAFGVYVAGPIYDENLPVTAALVAYRCLTLVWSLAALAAAAWLVDFRRGVLSRPHLLRPGSMALLLACALVLVAAERSSFALGLRTTRQDLEHALGGRRTTKHLVIHFPADKPRAEVERLERDLEFRYAQLSRFFGIAPRDKVRAYVYRNAAQKQRLVGAGDTNFAKPWNLEVHLTDAGFPLPAAKHELAHVFAASFGSPILRASAAHVLDINVGIVEGVATAADDPVDELSLQQWARAMRELNVAPDIRRIVGPWGFWTESGARAYTIAGAFLRWLADTRGVDRLRALYSRGDFAAAYGASLDELATAWEASVDQTPIDDQARRLAQVRFERSGLLARKCVREVAAIAAEARRVAASDPARAAVLYRRCAEIEPEVPAHRRAEAGALLAKRDVAGASQVLEALVARPGLAPGPKAEALMLLGDMAWERHEAGLARKHYDEVLALHRDRGSDRTAVAKISGLDDSVLGPALFTHLLRGPTAGSLLRLREVVAERPEWGLGWYLIGRYLDQQRDHRRALPYLERAGKAPLPSEDFVVENTRMLAISRFHAGDCAGMEAAWASFLSRLRTPGAELLALDWRQRCEFERSEYGAPYTDEG